jgi:malonyl-CoA O-methyltransferase
MSHPVHDKQQVRRAFERAAGNYDTHAVLQREVCERLLERLDYIKVQPGTVLDVGSGTGFAIPGLMKRYKKARLVAIDIAHAMTRQTRRHSGWRRKVHCVTADAERLPFADNSFDLVLSNMTLQWCNDLPSTLTGLRRVMRPGACLLFTSFGPDTLKELRHSWAQVDDAAHVSDFIDMHDIGDMLLQAGFSNPVMDMETITMTYRDVRMLMSDLKGIGASNARQDRRPGLTGRLAMQQMIDAYEEFRHDGVLPATWEVVYGHAWVPDLASGFEVELK